MNILYAMSLEVVVKNSHFQRGNKEIFGFYATEIDSSSTLTISKLEIFTFLGFYNR